MRKPESNTDHAATDPMPGFRVFLDPADHSRPGPGDNDHNPSRIEQRNLFDASIGEDNLFNGDRYKWSLHLTGVNMTNKTALYNFLSTFSGTHYVTPRSLTAELGFHF